MSSTEDAKDTIVFGAWTSIWVKSVSPDELYVPKHKCTFKRYVGLQKVIDCCDCGKEQDVHWTNAGDCSKSKSGV